LIQEERISRDKARLGVIWLRDESLEKLDNVPDPDVLGPGNCRPSTRFARDAPRARAYGQAVPCAEGAKTLKLPSKQFHEIAAEKDQ
jgi:hypothetical protein